MTACTPLRLRVMSFNLRGGQTGPDVEHLAKAMRLIAKWKPDLAGLQDVHRWLPPSSPQPVLLDELLDFEITFERQSGLLPNGYGLALASQVNPDLVHEVELPGGQEQCRAQDARFSLNGQFLHLVNTRFRGPRQQRCAQAGRLAARLRKYCRPVILVGDFAATSDGEELQAFEEAGLLPAGVTNPRSASPRGPNCRPNYVMVSRHFRVERVTVLSSVPGDYPPVVATLLLTDPGAGAVGP